MLSRALLAVVMGVTLHGSAKGQDLCSAVEGASIIADDGEFLGKLTSAIDAESIFNDIGKYGSDISSKSIWNDIGKYGSNISRLSPFNDITSTPPAIVKRGQVIGYLTVNKIMRGAVNPYVLKTCEF
jgi:hypothetical protein